MFISEVMLKYTTVYGQSPFEEYSRQICLRCRVVFSGKALDCMLVVTSYAMDIIPLDIFHGQGEANERSFGTDDLVLGCEPTVWHVNDEPK